MAYHVRTLRPGVLSEDRLERNTGLRRLCLAYLSSSYFELRRDSVRGVRKLRDMPIAKVDALCGLPLLPDTADANALLNTLAESSERERLAFPSGARDMLFLFSTVDFPEFFRNLAATIWNDYQSADQEDNVPLETMLGQWCEAIPRRTSLFEALGGFTSLLALASEHHDLQISVQEQEAMPLRQWISPMSTTC